MGNRLIRTFLSVAICGGYLLLLSCRTPTGAQSPLDLNGPCYICHINYINDELTVTHLKAKIGCAECHGISKGHINDEKIGATKPDVIFKRDQTNTFCRTCHKSHDVSAEKVVIRWQERRLTTTPGQQAHVVACTDCHGNHRIGK